jgi:hypothetical protein
MSLKKLGHDLKYLKSLAPKILYRGDHSGEFGLPGVECTES